MIAVAFRPIQGFGAAEWMLLLLISAVIPLFVRAVVSEVRRDTRKAAAWGFLLLLMVVALMTADGYAALVPIRDTCDVCREAELGWICYAFCW